MRPKPLIPTFTDMRDSSSLIADEFGKNHVNGAFDI
jgi:hypothetical protein